MRRRRAAPQRAPGLTEPYHTKLRRPGDAGCERVPSSNPDTAADNDWSST